MASEGFATFLWPKVYGRCLKIVHAWRCLGSKGKADRFTVFMAYRYTKCMQCFGTNGAVKVHKPPAQSRSDSQRFRS